MFGRGRVEGGDELRSEHRKAVKGKQGLGRQLLKS